MPWSEGSEHTTPSEDVAADTQEVLGLHRHKPAEAALRLGRACRHSVPPCRWSQNLIQMSPQENSDIMSFKKYIFGYSEDQNISLGHIWSPSTVPERASEP